MSSSPERTFRFPLHASVYIAREYIVSFAISFIFFFVVFLINQVLLLAEDILSKSVPFSKTMLLLLYSLPSVVALAFPFASLAGALMAAARLNADNELMGFSAGGISMGSLYLPFIVVGTLIALFSFVMNDYFLPLGARDFQKVYRDLLSQSASLELEPYSVKRYPDTTLVTGAPKGGLAGDVLIFQADPNGPDRVMAADSASIAMQTDQNAAVIAMNDVWAMQVAPGLNDRFSISTADSVTYRLSFREPLVGFSSTGPSDMASGDLQKKIKVKEASLKVRRDKAFQKNSSARTILFRSYTLALDPGTHPGARGAKNQQQPAADLPQEPQSSDEEPRLGLKSRGGPSDETGDGLSRGYQIYSDAKTSIPSDRSLQIYKLEYHKKFAIPAAGFFFALLAFPLGLGSRKAGRTAGFGLGLLLSVIYWGMLFLGQTWGLKSQVEPWFAIWAPNILVTVAAAGLWIIRHFSSRRLA
ncbi:MAG: LptF/LptG family permease [Spirochaetaceae bacterium]|nr:LptF/LptG family permease [Spirochaetaceae bacterium]